MTPLFSDISPVVPSTISPATTPTPDVVSQTTVKSTPSKSSPSKSAPTPVPSTQPNRSAKKRKLEAVENGQEEFYTLKPIIPAKPRPKSNKCGILPRPPFHRVQSTLFFHEFPMSFAVNADPKEDDKDIVPVPDISASFRLNLTQQNLDCNVFLLFRFSYKINNRSSEFRPRFLKIILNETKTLTAEEFDYHGISHDACLLVVTPIAVHSRNFQLENRITMSWAAMDSDFRKSWNLKSTDFKNLSFGFRVQKAVYQRRSVVLADISEQFQASKIGVEKISKQLSEIGENDLQTSSEKVHLLCPVSKHRLILPVRGKNCQHLQCFEAGQYVDLNKNSKTAKWKCPVCNLEFVSLNELIVDGFILDLLQKFPTAKDLEVSVVGNRLRVVEMAPAQTEVVDVE